MITREPAIKPDPVIALTDTTRVNHRSATWRSWCVVWRGFTHAATYVRDHWSSWGSVSCGYVDSYPPGLPAGVLSPQEARAVGVDYVGEYGRDGEVVVHVSAGYGPLYFGEDDLDDLDDLDSVVIDWGPGHGTVKV